MRSAPFLDFCPSNRAVPAPLSLRSCQRRGTRTLLALILLGGIPASAQAEDRDNCLYCHQFPGLSRLDSTTNQVRLFYIDPAFSHSSAGPHARLACTDCHQRDEVTIVPHRPVTPVDCTRQCHLVRPDAPERRFSHASVARMLEQSVHSASSLKSLKFTGGALLGEGQSNCLFCHDEPVFRRPVGQPTLALKDPSARCDTCHAEQIPLDTDYLLHHVNARLAPARPPLEMAQVCSVCHSDPAVLAITGKTDAVASYVRSFHGKSALLGDQNSAGCVDCHVSARQNAHLLLGAENPASSVHQSRVADACLRCHTSADSGIAATAVHLDLPTSRGTIDFVVAAAFILLTIISFVPSALIVILELTQLVVNRHASSSAPVKHVLQRVLEHPDGARRLVRFRPSQRVQHWVLTLLFIALALTGFPMKFADQVWAAALINWFGGLAIARTVHHWAGIALVAGFALHLIAVFWSVVKTARLPTADGRPRGIIRGLLALPMVTSLSDLRKTGQLLAYLAGLRRERPMFGRFSAGEKFEYFGVLWGTTLLGLTGLILWGEQITSHLVGGRAFNIAAIIHTYEAFLAVIHVGILHICNVILAPHVFPLSLATITGRTPPAKLADENAEFVLAAARDLGIATDTPGAGEGEVPNG